MIIAESRSRLLDNKAQPAGSRAPIVSLGGQRLLSIDYDLGIGGGNNIEVGKTVTINGRRAGTVSVSIDQNSQLHLSSLELGAMLPESHPAQVMLQGGYITFDALRSNGVAINYDPVEDVLVLRL